MSLAINCSLATAPPANKRPGSLRELGRTRIALELLPNVLRRERLDQRDVALGDEEPASVDLGREAILLHEIQDVHGHIALEVLLLVDGGDHVAFLQAGERPGSRVKAAAQDVSGLLARILHGRGQPVRGDAAEAEEAFQIGMADYVGG